jgi:hypothetical protein
VVQPMMLRLDVRRVDDEMLNAFAAHVGLGDGPAV